MPIKNHNRHENPTGGKRNVWNAKNHILNEITIAQFPNVLEAQRTKVAKIQWLVGSWLCLAYLKKIHFTMCIVCALCTVTFYVRKYGWMVTRKRAFCRFWMQFPCWCCTHTHPAYSFSLAKLPFRIYDAPIFVWFGFIPISVSRSFLCEWWQKS